MAPAGCSSPTGRCGRCRWVLLKGQDATPPPAPSLQPPPVTIPKQDVFRRHGGTLRDGEKVLRIEPGAVLTVTTTAGVYRAPRLIITAGAWTGALVAPLGLRLPLQVRVAGTVGWPGCGQG